MKKRAADVIMETLVSLGVKDCFGVVGGGAMHLDNALALCTDMNKYFLHHEQACSMAAETYARLSGHVAAVCVTSGPGATNAITGVMGAWVDSIPMIVVSGQVRYAISVASSGLPLRYRGTQEFDIVPSVRNMTKYAVMISDPLAVRREVIKAYDYAMNGRRGPVWLDVPLDVQSAMVEEDDLYPADDLLPVLAPTKQEMADLVELLRGAERPCFLLGSGIVSGGAYPQVKEFVDSIGIPCIGEAWTADVFYNDHPRFYGLSGNIGPRTGNFILQNADLIVALADSMGFRQTGFEQSLFAPNAKLIMIDADEYEPRKPGLQVDGTIRCDIKEFFKSWARLAPHVAARDGWLGYCDGLKARFDPFETARGIDMDDKVCMYWFWKTFDEVAPSDVIVCLGNNSANSAKVQVGKKSYGQRILTNYNSGPMGLDLTAAEGASVASGKPTLCVTGDGSIMMNLQELQCIKHYKLPVKIIIFANDGYNALRLTQNNYFNGVYIGCTEDTGVSFPSFEKVAEAFGYEYLRCETNGEVKSSLTQLLAMDGNVILEVRERLIDPVLPKLMSRMNEDGSFASPALEDMYPFIDPDEHERLMIGRCTA